MNNNFAAPLSREQRWEARRQAKFQSAQPRENMNNDPEIIVSSNNPTFQQQNFENFPNVNQPFVSSNNKPDYFVNSSPSKQNSLVMPQENPSSNNFFMNPISEYENRRRQVSEAYKNEAKQAIFLPKNNNRERPSSRTQVIEMNNREEILKKQNYAYELQKQISDKKNEKRKSIPIDKDYFPFGKPGAGAPFRDNQGNVIAVRPPKYNENDPKFLSPNEFYRKLGVQQGMQRYYSQPKFSNTSEINYQERPQVFQQPYIPQYNPPIQTQPTNIFQQPSPYQPDYAQYSNPQFLPPQYSQYPNQFYNPGYSNSSPQLVSPTQNFGYEKELPVYEPPSKKNNSHSNSPPPNQVIPDNSENYEKQVKQTKKVELARTLIDQMEEKRRQKEEEKRQRILEERLEEERLAKQRREIEEQYRREAMNKKKQFQDLQDFNSKAAAVIVEPKPQQQRKPRTPIEMPPPQPPPPRSHVIEPTFQPAQEIQSDNSKRFKTSFDDEITKLKNEFGLQQNELKQELLKMKTETQPAQELRFESQKEVERLREEMRQKSLQEDIRQKELLIALVNSKNTIYDSNTRLPSYKPTPFRLTSSKSEASLSLDSNKSLPNETKLIPLAQLENNFPTKIKPDDEKLKKAMNLDSLFPSLPDSHPNNISFEPIQSVNSSIGIERINKKNEQRLRTLDKVESNPSDELKKLDEMLIKYLEETKTRKPESSYTKKATREYRLLSIEEEEADLSLPKSQESDEIRLKWYKD